MAFNFSLAVCMCVSLRIRLGHRAQSGQPWLDTEAHLRGLESMKSNTLDAMLGRDVEASVLSWTSPMLDQYLDICEKALLTGDDDGVKTGLS